MSMYDKYKDKIQKSGVQFTRGGNTADSRMLWASTGIKGQGSGEKLDPIFHNIGEQVWGQQNNGPEIFKSMNPATWFQSNPQKTVEDLMGLKPGQDVFMFDFENIGTFNGGKANSMPWYSATELAMSRRKVANDYTLERVRNSDDISLLLRPMGEDLGRIDDLIERAKTGQMLRFTPDERRTLNDLILYGHDDPFNAGYFRMNKNGVTYLDKQLRDKQVPDGFIFNKDQINRMIVGRNNLVKYGATADQTLLELDAMFGNAGNIKLGGYNIDKYDVPLMLDYVNNKLGKNAVDPKAKKALERLQNSLSTAKSLDTFQMIKSLYKDHATSFGKNLTQSQVADTLGISKGTAHMALDDLNTTASIHNHLVKSMTTKDKLNLGWNVAGQMTSNPKAVPFGANWNSAPLQVGDSVFSLNGVAGSAAGKYDMVYRIDSNSGKLVPAYGDMRPNPLYKNTEYKVNRIFSNHEVNGEKFHGTILENVDDGLFHVIMRKDANDLKGFFQQNLVSTNDLLPGEADSLRKVTSWDRARRRWDRLFSSDGGPGELKAMVNAAHLSVNGATDEEIQNALVVKGKNGQIERKLGASAFRDLKVMAPRLVAESPYINEFLGKLESSSLSDKGRGLALSHFRKNMDAEFGSNMSDIGTGSSRVWNPTIDGESHIISLRNTSSIQAGVSRAIRAGHVGAPALTVVKNRMLEMVNQLYVSGPAGLASSEAGRLRDHIRGLREGDSYNTLLTELSTRIEQATDYEKSKGLNVTGANFMRVEDPSSINPERLLNLQNGWEGKKSTIAMRSLSNAIAMDSYGWADNHQITIQGDFFEKILRDHDDAMAMLMRKTGVSGTNLSSMSARDSLSRLASAFVDDDIAATYIWDDKKKGLVMALANKKQAETIFKLAPNEILESTKVAKVNVGLLSGDKLRLPGQERMANLAVINHRDKTYMGSTVDKLINNLIRGRYSIKEKLLNGEVFDAESHAKSIVSKTSENLMLNISKMGSSAIDEMKRFEERRSGLVRDIRSGFIDMSGFVPEMYKQEFGEAKYRQKMGMMDHNRGLSFVDTLTMDESKWANRNLNQWARDTYGLKVNTNNVKDVHAMNFIRSAESVDMRSFTPFGYYTPMARENIMKSGSYQPMDAASTRAKLISNGISGAHADRMLNRALVTDAYQATAGGELGYLNLRAAYIDTPQLNSMMQQRLGGIDPSASTYEGTVILREDVARSISTEREKKIKMASGADIDEKIWQLLEKHGQRDADGNITIKEGVSIDQLDIKNLGLGLQDSVGSAKHGRVTVGKLMRNGSERESYHYASQADYSYIKGFNVEKNELVLGELYNLQNGDKMISASGLRVTPIIKGKAFFDKLGIDAEIIAPEMSMKKEQFGSFLNSRVSMVVQEAMDKGVTVGGVSKQEVIGGLMEKHFGVAKGSLQFTNGQVVMSAMHGVAEQRMIKLDNLHKFMEDMSSQLGIKNYLNERVQYGQEAMAVGDVYRWQNDMGRTYAVDKKTGSILRENTEGLVRWGIKDQEALKSAAWRNASANGKSDSAVANWIDSHMSAVSRAQNSDINQYAHAVMRTIRDYTSDDLRQGKLSAGEVVIRNRGDAFGAAGVDDRNGIATARRTADGVTEVSSHAFAPINDPTQRGQVRTVADYQRSVVNMSGVDVDIYGTQGKIKESFADVLHANGGTALYELPTNVDGNRYVRFIDSGIAQIALDNDDDMAVLNKIQQDQVRIARYSEQLKADPSDKNMNRLRGAMNSHKANVKQMFDSSREGSLSDRLMSGKLDMSGRFTVQTLNPLDSGKYKEASMIVSRDRMAAMIDGAEGNILETLNKGSYDQLHSEWLASNKANVGPMSEVDSLVSKNAFMRNAALAEIEQKGLYGFVNRYPTIHETTHQVLNVQIGKDLPTELHNSRTAYLTVGTAVVQNADSDGDFMSAVLAHYRTNDATSRQALHNEMGQMHAYNAAQHEETAKLMREDITSEASKRNTTVGELWKDAEFRKGWAQDWMPRFGGMYDRETDIARFGKGDVGVLDNLRLKLSNMGGSIWNGISTGMGQDVGVRGRLDQLDEFGRLVSQKAISSKKFSIASIQQQITDEGMNLTGADLEAEIGKRMDRRDGAIKMLIGGIQDPTAKGIADIRRANDVLGMFATGDAVNITDQKYTMNSMLNTLQETYDMYGNRKGWLNNVFLRAGVSEGQTDAATTSNMLQGKGDMAIDTPFVKRLMEFDPEGFGKYMQTPIDNFHNTVTSNYKRINGLERSFDGLMGSTDSYLGRDMIDLGSNVESGAKSHISELAHSFASGLGGGGAIGFKSVQAGMAVFGGLWATSALMRSGPTPESTARSGDGAIQDVPIKGLLSQPTARVTPNESGEQINIQIASSQAAKMNHQQIAALVQQEMSAMMPMQLNMNMNVKDNTQNINQQYLQGIVAQAMGTGRII